MDTGIPFPSSASSPACSRPPPGAVTRSGAPAIVASSTDLGSVTELWRQPQTYARFLGQELSLVCRGPLLVLMPGGYGISSDGAPDPAGASALAGLRSPGGGGALGTAALISIERLATASGHSVPIPAATATASTEGGTNPIALIALAAGAVLIAVAWTASLRTYPAGGSAQGLFDITRAADVVRNREARSPGGTKVTGMEITIRTTEE